MINDIDDPEEISKGFRTVIRLDRGIIYFGKWIDYDNKRQGKRILTSINIKFEGYFRYKKGKGKGSLIHSNEKTYDG